VKALARTVDIARKDSVTGMDDIEMLILEYFFDPLGEGEDLHRGEYPPHLNRMKLDAGMRELWKSACDDMHFVAAMGELPRE
jgi:hypothetical protein